MTETLTERSLLANFCGDWQMLRSAAEEEGWLLILLEARDELCRAEQAPSDVLARMWRELGVVVDPRSSGQFANVPGQNAAAPPEGAYRCPHQRCIRIEEYREPGGPAPTCNLSGDFMTFD